MDQTPLAFAMRGRSTLVLFRTSIAKYSHCYQAFAPTASASEKEIALETIRALPDDCSLEEIAERIKFMAAVQKGLDQLDRGEGIPHDEVKRQFASWLTN